MKPFFTIFLILSFTLALSQDKSTLDFLLAEGEITKEQAERISKKTSLLSPEEKDSKRISFFGRVQFQYAYTNVNGSDYNYQSINESTSAFRTRRVYVGLLAEIGQGWSATVISHLTRNDTNGADYLDRAYISKNIDYDYLSGELDMGYRKVAFNLEESASGINLMQIERSITTRFFSESQRSFYTTRNLGFGSRYTGLFWQGVLKHFQGLRYNFMITNSQNYNLRSDRNFQSDKTVEPDDTVNLWSSISYTKSFNENTICTLGLNLGYGPGANAYRIQLPNGSFSSPQYSTIFAAEPYLSILINNFRAWTNFIYANVSNGKNNASKTASPLGGNIAAEYKFNTNQYGQIAPTIRLSFLNTNGRGVAIGDAIPCAPNIVYTVYDSAYSLYLGINWYIIDNTIKLQAGYELAYFYKPINPQNTSQFNNSATYSNTFRTQMQLLW